MINPSKKLCNFIKLETPTREKSWNDILVIKHRSFVRINFARKLSPTTVQFQTRCIEPKFHSFPATPQNQHLICSCLCIIIRNECRTIKNRIVAKNTSEKSDTSSSPKQPCKPLSKCHRRLHKSEWEFFFFIPTPKTIHLNVYAATTQHLWIADFVLFSMRRRRKTRKTNEIRL